MLSLNVDTYEELSTDIAGTTVSLYISPLHREQIDFFDDAIGEVEGFVEQIFEAMESQTGLPYPYPRLSVVEIPFLVAVVLRRLGGERRPDPAGRVDDRRG